MRPTEVNVELTDGTSTTITVFDLEAQIKSLLEDKGLMKPKNMTAGYNVLSGKSTEDVDLYGKVHMGNAWEPTQLHYCGNNSHASRFS